MRRTAALLRCRQQRRSRMLKQAFRTWALHCAWRRHARPALLRTLQRVANTRRSAMLGAWQGVAARARASRTRSGQLAHKRRIACMVTVLQAWSSRAKRSAALHAALRQVACRLQAHVKDHVASATLQVLDPHFDSVYPALQPRWQMHKPSHMSGRCVGVAWGRSA